MRKVIFVFGLAAAAAVSAAHAQNLDPRSSPVYRQCRGMTEGLSMEECVCMSQYIGQPRNETLITTLMQGFTLDKLRQAGPPLVDEVHAKGIYAMADDIYGGAGAIIGAAEHCDPSLATAGGNAAGGGPQADRGARGPSAEPTGGNGVPGNGMTMPTAPIATLPTQDNPAPGSGYGGVVGGASRGIGN